jgi:hypothetical protein
MTTKNNLTNKELAELYYTKAREAKDPKEKSNAYSLAHYYRKRSEETEDEKQERLRRDREKYHKSLSEETQQEREERQRYQHLYYLENRERILGKYKNMTPEEKAKRLAYAKSYRQRRLAEETPEQREARLARKRERSRLRRLKRRES